MASTYFLILFAALSVGSNGYHGSIAGPFQAINAFRYLLGIGRGSVFLVPCSFKNQQLRREIAEYPANSVACAGNTGELKAGRRNRWSIMFTYVHINDRYMMLSCILVVLVLTSPKAIYAQRGEFPLPWEKFFPTLVLPHIEAQGVGTVKSP